MQPAAVSGIEICRGERWGLKKRPHALALANVPLRSPPIRCSYLGSAAENSNFKLSNVLAHARPQPPRAAHPSLLQCLRM